MVKTSKIIEKIENFAPLYLASDWDNSGWQVYLGDFEINKVLLAISPTLDVIEQAIEKSCSLIICHHPLIFGKISKVNSDNFTTLPIIKAIQNNIQIYSAHTNLDITSGGVADILSSLLCLKNLEPIEKIEDNTGFGRIGELECEENLSDFLKKLKSLLKIDHLKLINPGNKTSVKKIAVCPGSGGDFIKKLKNVDLYITGDIRYHTALEINDIAVVDAGHLETERIILPVLQEILQECDIEIFLAEEKTPWQIV